MPPFLHGLIRLNGLVNLFLKAFVRIPGSVDLFKLFGVLAPTADLSVARDMAGDFAELDFKCYGKIFLKLGEHDAGDILHRIEVPTLIVAADRDLFTPLSVAERMHEKIRGSELFVIRYGSHYAPIEFPDCLNLRVEKFLREHGGMI
jgi:pimeloyl-ACP methyl ester carboxylesterase